MTIKLTKQDKVAIGVWLLLMGGLFTFMILLQLGERKIGIAVVVIVFIGSMAFMLDNMRVMNKRHQVEREAMEQRHEAALAALDSLDAYIKKEGPVPTKEEMALLEPFLESANQLVLNFFNRMFGTGNGN